MATLYDIPLTTLSGTSTTLADYTGKALLIVNVASKCGLTPQYTALEELYQQYKDKGLVVLGFPANDFAGQEPGSDQEIAKFCSTEYPVTFPLFSKISVVGPQQHPLYHLLTTQSPEVIVHGPWREGLEKYAAANGFPPPNPSPEILWNFEKFLIGRDGSILARFAPDMPPNDPRITSAVELAIAP
ncbi:redoxin domain-containing protein [Granulicella sp. 5B5]|uniref:glutathione peroxidase n=1 Tax=Granulicella sp. 5B5 TaxID=1617967 RepID=UPI0015F5801C|nr:redoxin domain-containing protein [Granulicella sp. 5B5]QMV17614.1 redoxin domain-containing protein [Granulicella sp. 5B5]